MLIGATDVMTAVDQIVAHLQKEGFIAAPAAK
jgi:hypothetical protein